MSEPCNKLPKCCQFCGVKYKPGMKHARGCEKPRVNVCCWCGVPFEPKSTRPSAFCSPSCRSKAWVHNNPDRKGLWHKNNRARINRRAAERYAINPKPILLKNKNWRKANPHIVNALSNEWHKKKTLRKHRLIEEYIKKSGWGGVHYREAQIMNLVASVGIPINQQDITKVIGFHCRGTVNGYLRELVAKGLLFKIVRPGKTHRDNFTYILSTFALSILEKRANEESAEDNRG